jgi:hypothetical protein
MLSVFCVVVFQLREQIFSGEALVRHRTLRSPGANASNIHVPRCFVWNMADGLFLLQGYRRCRIDVLLVWGHVLRSFLLGCATPCVPSAFRELGSPFQFAPAT